MPKGEIVGIKSVLPLVTTLSNIIDSTDLRSECSIHRATIQNAVITEQQFRAASTEWISSTESPVVIKFRTTHGG